MRGFGGMTALAGSSAQVALVRQSRDRRRQRLALDRFVFGMRPALSSSISCRMRVPALGRVVQLDVQHRDALDPQPFAQLVADERHRVGQRRDGLRPLVRLPDDAHPDLGVPQLAVRLDLRDRGEPHPRIGDLARDDAADLLPQQLIDPIRPLLISAALRRCATRRRPQGAAGEGAASTERAHPKVRERGAQPATPAAAHPGALPGDRAADGLRARSTR